MPVNFERGGLAESSASMPKSRQIMEPQRLEIKPIIIIETDTKAQVEEVRVDMADMKVESRQVELLTSVGSCVAICLHDPVFKCGGLAHVMLPTSPDPTHEPLPSKFADTAVPALIKGIRRLTGKESRLTAKISGGANMFANLTNNTIDIGGKNVRAVKAALEKNHIRLLAEDVGGTHGRRILFDVASGVTVIRHHNGEVKKL